MMELLDIYDGDGRLTGRTVPRGAALAPGEYYCSVHIWIRNRAGQFLIQRRALHKEPWPGQWATTGGCVSSGEASLAAARRETQEELGLTLACEPILLDRLRRSEFFTDLWLAEVEVDPAALTLQTSEVCDARWESEAGIRALVERGEFVAYRYLDDLFARVRALPVDPEAV